MLQNCFRCIQLVPYARLVTDFIRQCFVCIITLFSFHFTSSVVCYFNHNVYTHAYLVEAIHYSVFRKFYMYYLFYFIKYRYIYFRFYNALIYKVKTFLVYWCSIILCHEKYINIVDSFCSCLCTTVL